MKKIFSLVLWVGFCLIGCERSAQNVETTPCDPKKSKCAGSNNNILGGEGPSNSPSSDWTPYPSDSSSSPYAPTYSPSSSSTGTNTGTNNTGNSGGGSNTSATTGSSNNTSATGNPPNPTAPPPGTSQTPSPSGGIPAPSFEPGPSPFESLDPRYVDQPLGVIVTFDAAKNLIVKFPAANIAKFSELKYTLNPYGMNLLNTDPTGVQKDANGFIQIGKAEINVKLYFKYEGKDCQSDSMIGFTPTTNPFPVVTKCLP